MKQPLSKYATLLDTAVVEARPVQQLNFQEDLSLAQAYEIQAQAISKRLERGENMTGIKLGFTSKAKMEQMGVQDQVWGRLTHEMELFNGGDLVLGNYIHPRAEPEIAFKLGRDIHGVPSPEEIRDCLSGVAVAIEVIDSRYQNFRFSLELIVADNCSSAGYVLGDWKDPQADVADIRMDMSLNSEIVESGNSNAILGNPLASLNVAFRLADQYGFSLKKDMLILAGAVTPAIALQQGDQITVNAEHLGSVSLNVIG